MYHPEQISSKVLENLKLAADKYSETDVLNVVVTVPAYFNDM